MSQGKIPEPLSDAYYDRQLKSEMANARKILSKMEKSNVLKVTGWTGKMYANFMAGGIDKSIKYRDVLRLRLALRYCRISNPKVENFKSGYGLISQGQKSKTA